MSSFVAKPAEDSNALQAETNPSPFNNDHQDTDNRALPTIEIQLAASIDEEAE